MIVREKQNFILLSERKKMKTKRIRNIATAFSVLLLAGATTLASGEVKERTEDQEIAELMNEFSAEVLLESLGMEIGEDVSVYDIEGNLILLSKSSELTTDNYRTIFQSDFIMQESGNSIYIVNQRDEL